MLQITLELSDMQSVCKMTFSRYTFISVLNVTEVLDMFGTNYTFAKSCLTDINADAGKLNNL